ncbi:MAG TPA: TlyA family RNA methyltransferase [Bryobacteraceae bacterium]|nr:TlyA family RNA methyltransferase [Bryobacteraceae bacterium]
MKTPRMRLDQLLCERGLAESREKAKALILAGQVKVNGQRSDKAGKEIDVDAAVDVAAPPPYVSRGGFKLAKALDHWSINPAGWVCLDVGSSTGGFTDCLLQRGATRVYAFDVGNGQLDWKLRNDPRVILREGVNARHLQPGDVPEPTRLIVCDVSFISVTLILPVLPPLLCEDGELVILVKPQFEVGREQVGKGGIVRDPVLHQQAIDRVGGAACAIGYRTECIESPILGAEGNKEFLLYVRH